VKIIDPPHGPYEAVLQDLRTQRARIEIAIDAIEALRPQPPMMIDEGVAPPPPVKPKRYIPSDPEELRDLALRMMNDGRGLMEVKEELDLTQAQADEFFHS
jgi:hypothetical protein